MWPGCFPGVLFFSVLRGCSKFFLGFFCLGFLVICLEVIVFFCEFLVMFEAF